LNRAILCLGAVLLGGCAQVPDTYPVPPQFELPPQTPEQCAATDYFRAADPESLHYIVKDIQGIESNYRWTHAEPELRFFLNATKDRRFRMDFGVTESVLKASGPLKLVFLVNEHELGRETYASAGPKSFEKPVPPEWLHFGEENHVVIRVLNPWRAPHMGVLLGVILHAAGFPC
jgi:hypothetical protein